MNLIRPSFEILHITDTLNLIEEAGRTCYKSNLGTTEERNRFILRRILGGHESVLEHSLISVKFICDRGVSHELVRHRLCAFSQESTRYCNYVGSAVEGGVTFILPCWMKDKDQYGEHDYPYGYQLWYEAMLNAEKYYRDLRITGWSPQQARSVLPNSLKTEIIMSANFREWRHILKLRTSKAAHPQMREIMQPLLFKLKELVPIIFDDINCKKEDIA